MTETKFKLSKYSVIVTIIVLAILITSFIIISSQRRSIKDLKETKQLYIDLQDTLTKTRNNLNQETAKISVLTTTNEKQFIELQTKDATIIKLQALVERESKGRKTVEAAMVLANQTIVKLKDKLANQVVGDTTVSDTAYATYKKVVKDDWTSGTVVMGKYCFDMELKVRNEYEWSLDSEPYGKWPKNWFQKKEYANITNLNPNTETTTMKVYHNKPVANKPVKHFLEGTVAGAIIIIGLQVLLK
jgi:hypothetical protein